MSVLNRKERDRQLRRSDILKAAEHLFALKGYHKTTIRDIAKESQYATGTVYLHFKNKDDLYFGLLEEKLEHLLSIIKEKTGQVKDAKEKLEIYIREDLIFFEKNQDFFQISLLEGSELYAERRIFKSLFRLQMLEYTISMLKEAQEQGVINSGFDPEKLSDVLGSIIKTVTLKWLQEKERKAESLVSLSDTILRLFLYGAANK
ncbi:MAG: TetR/AcrR family transcriptional regulator [Candidatus Omnitrophica bacterium]|nr:TetR/AcrR family transcriptional regulator [Candidatus Omnitrophota bacterium]